MPRESVDDARLYVVLIKQLLHCVLIKQLLIARAVSKRTSIKPWRTTQAKILCMRLASLAASSILHGGLIRSSLRPRVMCGIRDSSHTHMHTQNTHTPTHTHTRTHTHTHKYIHTPTPTPVARSGVCVSMSSLSLSKSLSLWVCLRVSQGAVMPCSRTQTKTRGNPDRGTRVTAVHSTHQQQTACSLCDSTASHSHGAAGRERNSNKCLP
jgi:hypothetical protein